MHQSSSCDQEWQSKQKGMRDTKLDSQNSQSESAEGSHSQIQWVLECVCVCVCVCIYVYTIFLLQLFFDTESF